MALNFIAKAPANFLRFSQPRLQTFVKYAKVELTPPSPGELGQVSLNYHTYKQTNILYVCLCFCYMIILNWEKRELVVFQHNGNLDKQEF